MERQRGIQRALISDGAPLFGALKKNVGEEILYNVIIGKGHSCPGSLLHGPVSSHAATNDVICRLQQPPTATPQESTLVEDVRLLRVIEKC